MTVPHLTSLADLTVPQLNRVITHAHRLKRMSTPWLAPQGSVPNINKMSMPSQSLFSKSIALLFSKRSTRTRLSAETAAELLGGRALFLGKEDIQLGVNETTRDSARVIGGMTQGIFARVGSHSEIEELATHSPVPVLNALSDLWHPTQILADIMTLREHAGQLGPNAVSATLATDETSDLEGEVAGTDKKSKDSKKKQEAARRTKSVALPEMPSNLTIAWVGDSTNILHDMLVSYPRMGHSVRVATPSGAAYQCPTPVWDKVVELGCDKRITWTTDPREAVNGADIIVTDTWISMGQEAEKAQRLQDFAGYQVTEALAKEGGANPNWKFLHCLPRKADEVDDEVFYGPRSLVFPESDNRKWTIMALFDLLFGRQDLYSEEALQKDLSRQRAYEKKD